MRFAGIDCPGCANHNGSSAQTHSANFCAAAITMRFAGNENRCYANHNGSSAHNRGGAQRRLRAPQPLLEALETAPATVESWGGPAATPRAAARSGGSADCARHCGDCARLLKDLHVPDNTNRSAEEMKMLICMRSM